MIDNKKHDQLHKNLKVANDFLSLPSNNPFTILANINILREKINKNKVEYDKEVSRRIHEIRNKMTHLDLCVSLSKHRSQLWGDLDHSSLLSTDGFKDDEEIKKWLKINGPLCWCPTTFDVFVFGRLSQKEQLATLESWIRGIFYEDFYPSVENSISKEKEKEDELYKIKTSKNRKEFFRK